MMETNTNNLSEELEPCEDPNMASSGDIFNPHCILCVNFMFHSKKDLSRLFVVDMNIRVKDQLAARELSIRIWTLQRKESLEPIRLFKYSIQPTQRYKQ
jgi:hypothetical protein